MPNPLSPAATEAGFSHPDRPSPQPPRRRYPSDLSDSQWDRVSQLLPGDRPRGRRRAIPPRDIVNALNYRWTTGCAWRMLPHDYPKWETVYAYFNRWQRAGLLRKIRETVVQRPVQTRAVDQRVR